MADPVADTVAYYDRHAEAFAAQTATSDLGAHYARFLRDVPRGGRILDAGCGVGRDALAFSQMGYEVVAFDASEEMVRLARKRVPDSVPVFQLRFEDATWREEFDGVWACASLLHVDRSTFGAVIGKLAAALRPSRSCYISFKLGEGDRTISGRTFVNHTAETLRDALALAPVELTEIWISEDVRPERNGEYWVNAICQRK